MRYLTFPTQAAAEVVSRRVARARGCKEDAVTQFWYSCYTAEDGECLMTVPKGDEADLEDSEVKRLIDKRPTKFEYKEDGVV